MGTLVSFQSSLYSSQSVEAEKVYPGHWDVFATSLTLLISLFNGESRSKTPSVAGNKIMLNLIASILFSSF